ncbi:MULTISPECIES: sensor histidine kinase [Clostridia]|jgi:two-component system, sensor histidine kinase and response regulator|uniref:sensor histidine kinase n=1 Tax=Clostridia TaxID=186801 RepID=UPI000E4F3EB7|nr:MULTISPECIES: HAMP domain-containing sensor histidine kinase [Clostridia]MBS5364655.1 HAMP domain-containing histidine kinase [Clostridium sp.]RHP24830.1 sensor histidine kinase [Clostridium sp. AF34-13]UYJ41469.1 MAG: HAMP domain-containing histidine kinase [Lachnospiraceae bacterium]
MVNNREDIEECFLKCPTETRQSFMAALQMVYDEVFEINPYDDCVYILNSRYDTAMCGMTVCYSDFFGEYVDAMVYLYDCEEFISDFEPEALRKFAESEDMKQEKKFVRLRTDTNKKEWYIATLIKNPADKRRIILLMKNENEVCINEMQKKAIMEDYDYVIGINIQNEKISIYSNNEAKYGHSTLYNVFYEKFLNQRIKKYVLSEYAEKISEKMQLENIKRQLEKNEVYICYATMQYRGEIFHKKFRFVYLDDKKETILLSQMDVTEQIEREEKKNDAVKIAVQEARKANESKSYFLSRMSHDMRTPLNAIIGMDMIAASHINETDKVMESLNSILYSSKNLLELVNEVLDVSNFERGKFSLNDAVFSWTKEIENIMQLIRPLADKKHLEFDTDYKKLRFENVVGDAKRIRQLCINLLSNAVKYTEDGGKIYFSISERGVVKEETDNIYMEYEIIVKDNGIGISEEFMPYLFDMFEREKKVLGENISGTGLGMTIARNLARLMDGDIYVESKENEGTKFSVTLRLRLPAPDESVTTDDINMGISGGVIRF